MKWKGLNAQEVLKRQQKFGLNIIPEKESGNWLTIVFNQFKSPLIYILLFVIVISIVFKKTEDIILVSLVVLLDVVMGYFQEYSAQKTLKNLKKVIQNKTIIIRNNLRQTIDTQDLVPDDIVLLGQGDRVPADCELLEGGVFISEAILTGEEELVEKNISPSNSTLYMGTIISSGRCTAKVKLIGPSTEVGKIGVSLTEIKERLTPLQKKMELFSKNLALLVAVISIVIFVIGITTDHGVVEMVSFSLILAVAAIPEGLPIAVTVILSLGMNRVLKHNGLVKKLLSIETLGSTSVICTDKTGTLTEGVMKVVKVDTKDQKMLTRGLLALNTRRTSLEIATWEYLKKYLKVDPQTLLDDMQIIYEEIFESEKKYALTTVKLNGISETFVLGAPEIVLKFTKDSKNTKTELNKQFIYWTKKGLRVVGIIRKKGANKDKKNFNWLGMIGIEDPIRPGVGEAIKKAISAGINIKIVTGDYLHTAQKVASQIGIKVVDSSTIEGKELERITPHELKERIDKINLFCRVSPHQKLKIITALQDKGEVVAMTGDGINDAPALKKADIGVVVGNATDVAKDSADLILLDNNFGTIVEACEEGRIIYQNIIKVVGYVLSNSLVEIVLIVGSMILNIPFPLTVIQILWLHLICDGPLDIALGFEPGDPKIMDEKPQKFSKTNIFSSSILFLVLAISFTAGIISLLIFKHQYGYGHIDSARTLVFSIVGSIDLVYIFAYKDLSRSVLDLKRLFNNKFLLLSVAYGFIVLILGIYLPSAQKILHTQTLTLRQWPIIIGVALLTTIWVEIVKKIKRFS